MFVNELVRLGADVRIDGHHAVVRGRERLSSAPVVATDIRGCREVVEPGGNGLLVPVADPISHTRLPIVASIVENCPLAAARFSKFTSSTTADGVYR